jgi:hypothetical protein
VLSGCNEPEAVVTDLGAWQLVEAPRPVECVAQIDALLAELPPPEFDSIEYELDGEPQEMRLLLDGVEVERRVADDDGLFSWEDQYESDVGPVNVTLFASAEVVLYVLAWQLPSNACSFGMTREGRLEGDFLDY